MSFFMASLVRVCHWLMFRNLLIVNLAENFPWKMEVVTGNSILD